MFPLLTVVTFIIAFREYEKALERANTELNKYRSDFEERVSRVKYDDVKKQLEAKTKIVDALNEELESAASRYRYFYMDISCTQCRNTVHWKIKLAVSYIIRGKVVCSVSQIVILILIPQFASKPDKFTQITKKSILCVYY